VTTSTPVVSGIRPRTARQICRLRFGLSYRDVEELLAERGIEVDHVTAYRWVRRFAPLLVDAGRFGRHRVAGRWVYLYRAVDQFGQVVDVYASTRRDSEAARRFFQRPVHRAQRELSGHEQRVAGDQSGNRNPAKEGHHASEPPTLCRAQPTATRHGRRRPAAPRVWPSPSLRQVSPSGSPIPKSRSQVT
jgi:transposase-like protein